MTIGSIGVIALNQLLNHRHHLINKFSGARHLVRLHCPKRAHIIQKPLGGFGCDRLNGATAFLGAHNDFIINIGEITHIGHMIRPVNMAQQSIQHIKHHHRARVADMGAVINRWPTNIHAHVFSINRGKYFFFAGLGIV